MSLYDPYFVIHAGDDTNFQIFHNCNGALNFRAEIAVDEKTKRLIDMAIEEGKRIRSREILKLLGVVI